MVDRVCCSLPRRPAFCPCPGQAQVESLVISRSWQGPRPKLKSPSLCGTIGLGFPVCHRHFFLPPYQGAEVQRGEHCLLCHCLVTKQSPSGDQMRQSSTL